MLNSKTPTQANEGAKILEPIAGKQVHFALDVATCQADCYTCTYFKVSPRNRPLCMFTGEKLPPKPKACRFYTEVAYA